MYHDFALKIHVYDMNEQSHQMDRPIYPFYHRMALVIFLVNEHC